METLSDRPCRPGGVLLVGINPAPVSVVAGHYYRGALGKRIWARLRRVGLLSDAAGAWEDDAFVEAGNGLTDLVKRATRSEGDLSPQELADGKSALARKVRDWRPGLLLFAFRAPAEALIEPSVSPGPCGDFEGIPAFLLSGPYARREDADANEALLRERLGGYSMTSGPIVKSPAAPPEAPTPPPHDRRQPATGASHPTQRVTAADLGAGRVRLPARSVSGAKDLFPAAKGEVDLELRGTRLTVPYDPRDGPDRQRSGVLRVGRDTLRRLVRQDEVLHVSVGSDGLRRLD